MSIDLRPIPRVVARVLVLAVAAIMALSSVAVYLQAAADVSAIEGAGVFVNLFSVDNELAVPAWFSSLLFFLGGAAVAVLGLLLGRGRPGTRRGWLLLAAVLVFFSADEMAAIHEYLIFPLRRNLDLPGFLHFAWVIPYALVTLAVAALALKLIAELPPRTRWRLLGAGAVFVAGALGMEMVGATVVVAGGEDSLRYQVITSLEELAELAGLALFLHTVVAYLVELVPAVELHRGAEPVARRVGARG